MPYDYNKADVHPDTLHNHGFMDAMSKIHSAVASIVADAPSTKGKLVEAFSRESGADKQLNDIANELGHVEGLYAANGHDAFARANMLRLVLKDITLGVVFGSKAIQINELSNLDVNTDSVTAESVAALKDMGLNTLAQVADFYVAREVA